MVIEQSFYPVSSRAMTGMGPRFSAGNPTACLSPPKNLCGAALARAYRPMDSYATSAWY